MNASMLDLCCETKEQSLPSSSSSKMKAGTTKNNWKSLISRRPTHKSSTNYFHFFQKVKKSADKTPVFLNIYDLTPANDYFYWAGLGIFHSGLEVYGVEYAFGAHDYPTTGVFEVDPRQCPGFKYRKSIRIGTTTLDPIQIREFMDRLAVSYSGDSYHLIVKNCNHFCEDACFKLTGRKIPKWVNRLARIGLRCNCILPESMKVCAVSDEQESESEKKKLRSAFSGWSSFPPFHSKEVPLSSLFLHSMYKGWIPPWTMNRSKTRDHSLALS